MKVIVSLSYEFVSYGITGAWRLVSDLINSFPGLSAHFSRLNHF
jgi:hypothetical protein